MTTFWLGAPLRLPIFSILRTTSMLSSSTCGMQYARALKCHGSNEGAGGMLHSFSGLHPGKGQFKKVTTPKANAALKPDDLIGSDLRWLTTIIAWWPGVSEVSVISGGVAHNKSF